MIAPVGWRPMPLLTDAPGSASAVLVLRLGLSWVAELSNRGERDAAFTLEQVVLDLYAETGSVPS